MTLEILTFGIARDIIGSSVLTIELVEGANVDDLKRQILERYPRFIDLSSLMIAVNAEYGNENTVLREGDEIALIPPVSGG
jgi:molybdopterin converting factor subunit 1